MVDACSLCSTTTVDAQSHLLRSVCDHAFCEKCILEHLLFGDGAAGSMSCPQCQKSITHLTSLGLQRQTSASGNSDGAELRERKETAASSKADAMAVSFRGVLFEVDFPPTGRFAVYDRCASLFHIPKGKLKILHKGKLLSPADADTLVATKGTKARLMAIGTAEGLVHETFAVRAQIHVTSWTQWVLRSRSAVCCFWCLTPLRTALDVTVEFLKSVVTPLPREHVRPPDVPPQEQQALGEDEVFID